MLEPRRLAARAVAQRMAQTLGEAVGRTVGYRMRMDTRVSRDTRIEVVTEGVLTRMLQNDPALEGSPRSFSTSSMSAACRRIWGWRSCWTRGRI